jgi:hypothetical protein
MSQMNDREKAFENKYAKDQDTLFRIEAKACKLLGLWAAQEMGHDDPATYAGDLVSHNLKEPGLADVVKKVTNDMAAKGKPASNVETMMAQFLKDAESQVRTPQ